jgi:ATP-binding cassette subfamily B protein
MIRLLKSYLPRISGLLAAVVAFQCGAAVFMLYLPRISGDIINNGVLKHDTGYVWAAGGVMLLVTLAQAVCMTGGIYFGSRSSMSVGRDVRRDLFHKVMTLSARELTTFGAPTLITRVTNDVQQVQMAVLMTCTQAVMSPALVIFGTYMAFRENVQLAWVLLAAIPVLVVTMTILLSRMHPAFMAMQDRIDDVNQVLREQIAGMRVVRAFVRERAERQRFGQANAELTATALTTGRLMAVMFPVVMLVQNLTGVAIVWFGGHLINSHQMSLGSLIAFIGYITQVLMGLMQTVFMFMMIPRAAVASGRIMQVLDTDSSVVPPLQPTTDIRDVGALEFRDVEFRYPGAIAPVLEDISFGASRGQTTAIVGSTGAGKTTLINLIARLVDVSEGAVYVDGVDVRDLTHSDLSRRVGLVPQKPYLFSGTVASNLRHGKPDATEGEMWDALTVAQAADFVRAMPGGLEARILQGGTNVSGGQRQRLAIARALIREPEIYLFDDSFSALDLATDARLREALIPHTRNSTVVIVAQRISTIMSADRILVLEDGHCVGLGSHWELLDSCPTYAEIVNSQLSTEQAA